MSVQLNQSWITWILGAGVTLSLGLGGFFLNIQQEQLSDLRNGMNANAEKIWEQQKVTVTQDNLDRFKTDISQMVDNKFQVISTRMDAMSSQMSTVVATVNRQADTSNQNSQDMRAILEYLQNKERNK